MNNKNILMLALGFILITNGYSQDYWQDITTTPDSSSINSMAISPSGDIFIGMWGFDDPGGIYRSVDNAQTWEYLGLIEKSVYTIEICPNGDILAGVNAGIYKSTDNGETWYEVYFEVGNIVTIFSLSNGYVFAGGVDNLQGILRSTNFGETWDTVFIFPGYGEEYLYSMTISPEGNIYAGTYNMFGPSGIYHSTDMGDSWEAVDFPGNDVFSLAFHPQGDLFAGCVGDGLYRYNFNTQQWTQLLYWITPDDILFVGNDIIYLGCNGDPNFMPGVLYSEDNGQNFEWLNSGMNGGNGADIEKFSRHPNDYIFAQGYSLYISFEPVFTDIEHFWKSGNRKIKNSPNPFSDYTIIAWDVVYQDKYVQLIITDTKGKIVYNKYIENSGNYTYNNVLKVTGIFFYSIIGKDNIYSGKMVLVK
ncbi:MAG: hypothetical protein H8D45_05450 [Bacteroidetes bacterium]|nr:hypothetical protein [Bacteroidota bacterium]MBL7103568.1 hypothetical protein [Bacteroidales bacterium]